jgi:hypothetical protein
VLYKGRYLNEEYYVVIEDTVYDIPRRLREIDPGYFLVLNRQRDKFEVHHIENRGGTYCLTVPYDELDDRLLEYVRKTRSENAKKLFEEMEKNNQRLEERKKKDFKDYVGEVAKDVYQYAAQSHKWAEARLTRGVS